MTPDQVMDPPEQVTLLLPDPATFSVDPPPPGESLGAVLRAARLRAGFTTYELAAITHLPPGRIAELEDDDFLSGGPAALARGRVAVIARACRVDGLALLAEFDAAAPVDQIFPVLPLVPAAPRPRRNWSAVLAALLGLVALYPVALVLALLLS